uniref:Aminoacyl-transfer RNA synthetases class-II family profile domain-containing protein n=1 Tax=Timema poppense TaxID=170557 RepID=A0A7R9D390_TIMPO|nr:unnamed protein product [Timema poppensis]
MIRTEVTTPLFPFQNIEGWYGMKGEIDIVKLPCPYSFQKVIPNFKVGFSKAMSSGWVSVDKSSGAPVIHRKVESVTDTVSLDLQRICSGQGDQVAENFKQDYKKRKLLQQVVTKSFLLGKGSNFSTTVNKPETDLTPEMIATGSWRQKTFKPYNLDALGVPPECGHLHPLLKVRSQFRQIFLEMGIDFLNLINILSPEPRLTTSLPVEYLERVKKVHSEGGYGSQGYGYDWKIEEAQKNLLRTHTTAVSARMLYKLAQNNTFHPVKYFSIDRVFRNETLDATHLAEFHQVEGVRCPSISGILYEFFGKLGITKLHFKPAYNPYTEPSMEIFSYHDGLGKWMEVGNSGVFRPEMLRPMGLPEDVNVIAWGLSLERPTMIKYKVNNIRDLVGPKVDLQMVYDSPICRLDKHETNLEELAKELEKRWDEIIAKLEALRSELTILQPQNKTEERNEEIRIVIFANPVHPPYSVLVLLKLLSQSYNVSSTSHLHSSIDKIQPELFTNEMNGNGHSINLTVNFIWKNHSSYPVLIVSPISHCEVVGEINVARYLNRLLESRSRRPALVYESDGPVRSGHIDVWLDRLYTLSHGNNKECSEVLKSASAVLAKQEWLTSLSMSVADVCLWSALKQGVSVGTLPLPLNKWFKNCSNHSFLGEN